MEGTSAMIKSVELSNGRRIARTNICLYGAALPKEGVVAASYDDRELAEMALRDLLDAMEREYLFYQFPTNDSMKTKRERE